MAAPLLTVHSSNGRYFTDDGTRAVLLSGSYGWGFVIDYGAAFPVAVTDWESFIDTIAGLEHTFIRIWTVDYSWKDAPPDPDEYMQTLCYARPGPSTAADGAAKFDLTSYSSVYDARLRSVVQYGETKGIYCGVMLFECVNARNVGAAYKVAGHPYGSTNNINGMTGEVGGSMVSCYTAAAQPTGVAALQEAYVEHMLDLVEDLPDVIIEIANEAANNTDTYNWQDAMVDVVQAYELAHSTYQHPVWRSSTGNSVNDSAAVLATAAEMVSPCSGWTGYSPAASLPVPATDGSRVIMLDTDHTTGLGSIGFTALPDYVWRAFTRGHNFAYLDDFAFRRGADSEGTNPNLTTRAACGHIVYYSRRVNLVTCVPNGALASTGYCLATPGTDYIVYQPTAAAFTVDLSSGSGQRFRAEWFSTTTGEARNGGNVPGGSAAQSFTPPFGSVTGVALLLTRASRPESTSNRLGRGWR